MQIPEYSQRIIPNEASKGNINIQEPKVMGDISYLNQINKQAINTASELSGIYFDMKKERDQGIVNELMNQFSIAKSQKFQELQEQYKGSNAQGIVDAYKQWQDDYFNTHLGMNKDSGDDTLYLENEDQIKMAKDQFARDWSNSINSLSRYASTELENYKNNQFSARMEMMATDLSNEDDENNIKNTIENIGYNMGQKYAGQSTEFIELQTKKLINAAMDNNVKKNISINPTDALVKLQNDVFKNNLDEDSQTQLKALAMKSFIESEGTKLASYIMNGGSDKYVYNEDTYNKIKGIVDEYGKDFVASQIELNANKKYKSKKKENKAKAIAVDNSFVTKLYPLVGSNFDPDVPDNIKQQNLAKADELLKEATSDVNKQEIVSLVYDTVQRYEAQRQDIEDKENRLSYLKETTPATASESKDVKKWLDDTKEMESLENELKTIENQITRDSDEVGLLLDDIHSGSINDIRDINLNKFNPVEANYILNEFYKEWNYRQFADVVNEKYGSDITKTLENNFKAYYGAKSPTTSAVLYNEYKNNFKDLFMKSISSQKSLPTSEYINGLAIKAYTQTLSDNPEIEAIQNMAGSLKTESSRLRKEMGYVSNSTLIDTIKDDEYFEQFDNDSIKTIVNYIQNGNIYAARAFIKMNNIKNSTNGKGFISKIKSFFNF